MELGSIDYPLGRLPSGCAGACHGAFSREGWPKEKPKIMTWAEQAPTALQGPTGTKRIPAGGRDFDSLRWEGRLTSCL